MLNVSAGCRATPSLVQRAKQRRDQQSTSISEQLDKPTSNQNIQVRWLPIAVCCGYGNCCVSVSLRAPADRDQAEVRCVQNARLSSLVAALSPRASCDLHRRFAHVTRTAARGAVATRAAARQCVRRPHCAFRIPAADVHGASTRRTWRRASFAGRAVTHRAASGCVCVTQRAAASEPEDGLPPAVGSSHASTCAEPAWVRRCRTSEGSPQRLESGALVQRCGGWV